ncbi:MAG TPA: nicotinate (nicotinamide) nucleotide adenylyltransferase, partial [bacterium]|nr:nicotinate (nicotinamide) nucleotide adenylyltransferase [bacterium]
MRLGILGGSFDPPHHAHLAMARAALAWGLDQVLLIPARVPPHKQTHALTDPYLRYAMAELAALNEPGLLVDPLELEREGPSYTIDTLRALHGRGDLEECFVLVGEDNWRTLGTWKDLDQFPPLARFMVFEREAAEEPGPAVPETVRQGAVHFPGFA